MNVAARLRAAETSLPEREESPPSAADAAAFGSVFAAMLNAQPVHLPSEETLADPSAVDPSATAEGSEAAATGGSPLLSEAATSQFVPQSAPQEGSIEATAVPSPDVSEGRGSAIARAATAVPVTQETPQADGTGSVSAVSPFTSEAPRLAATEEEGRALPVSPGATARPVGEQAFSAGAAVVEPISAAGADDGVLRDTAAGATVAANESQPGNVVASQEGLADRAFAEGTAEPEADLAAEPSEAEGRAAAPTDIPKDGRRMQHEQGGQESHRHPDTASQEGQQPVPKAPRSSFQDALSQRPLAQVNPSEALQAGVPASVPDALDGGTAVRSDGKEIRAGEASFGSAEENADVETMASAPEAAPDFIPEAGGVEGLARTEAEPAAPPPASASHTETHAPARTAETPHARPAGSLLDRWQADLQGLVSELRTEAGGWQRLRLRLDDEGSTVTLRARREADHVAVTVAFSDPNLRQVAQASAERLHTALENQFGQHVAFSFGEGGGDARQHAHGDADPAPFSQSPTPPTVSDPAAPLPRRTPAGKREWIG